ncbi:DUF433 domain-containing protein [Tautonia plasticadhaerens]|uniref:Uncharacterized protein n=1 Tax=Tautonia plasticadhaerens TaxID=2527974 RepID=A0A518H734_9BACT|nr:DUF433 domain-containing protein [Tautonia plasticadhaerens]QDV36632.1 hypothetical protein ElP_45600 [Tautonia plasticadhaerens]
MRPDAPGLPADFSDDESAPPARSPALGLALLDPDRSAFDRLASGLVAGVDASDALAVLLAELLVLAAERLRRLALAEPRDGLPELGWCRAQALAERNARAALRELQRHQDRAAGPPPPAPSPGPKPRAKAGPTPEPGPEPVEAPPAPVPESTPEEVAEASAHWRRHIALVRGISEEWPILLRTRREVEAVAAWFGDGKTDDELMRWYPDLSRADLAACRACDAEGLCGPFDPADGPYPPGLPVLDDLPDGPGP